MVVALCLLCAETRAERTFFVNDNAFGDVPSFEDQARLLKELGYDGICTRPQKKSPTARRARN